MNLKGNLTSKGLQGSIGKSRMQGILGTNPAAIPISVDNALSLSSTNPVQNKVITAAITNRLWSDEVKAALLQIVEKVAYIDDQGQTYYDALYDALYPPTNLDSIGAVFDSSATIYNTDTLDDLKQHLTVTAYYTDGTSETVTTYTLSGSMDAGTQTITVSYGGKTTTFSVTVVEWLVSIDAVFTQGQNVIYDFDSLDRLNNLLVVSATYGDSTTVTVTDYLLSGTLAAGISSITVSYGGKTDTFNVVVSSLPSLPSGYTAYDYIYNNKIGGASTTYNGICIDTGLAGNAYSTIEYEHDIRFSYSGVTNTTTSSVYGSRDSTGPANYPNSRVLFVAQNEGLGNVPAFSYQYNDSPGSWYALPSGVCRFITKNKTVYMNGEVVAENVQGSDPYAPSSITIALFGEHRDNFYGVKATIYMRHFIVRNSYGEAVAAMFPCKNSGGTAGMYDVVREVFKSGNTASYLIAGND